MKKYFCFLLSLTTLFFTSCCSLNNSGDGCENIYAHFYIVHTKLPLASKAPEDAYFVRELVSGTDSVKMEFDQGLNNLKYEYFYTEESNFNILNMDKQAYIFSIPSLSIRDTISNIQFKFSVEECGTCNTERIYTEEIEYLQNGVSKKADDYLYDGFSIVL